MLPANQSGCVEGLVEFLLLVVSQKKAPSLQKPPKKDNSLALQPLQPNLLLRVFRAKPEGLAQRNTSVSPACQQQHSGPCKAARGRKHLSGWTLQHSIASCPRFQTQPNELSTQRAHNAKCFPSKPKQLNIYPQHWAILGVNVAIAYMEHLGQSIVYDGNMSPVVITTNSTEQGGGGSFRIGNL